MKTLFREWVRCPYAVVAQSCNFVFNILYILLNTKIVAEVSRAVTDYKNLNTYLPGIIIMCLVNTALGVTNQYLGKRSLHLNYTVTMDALTDKLLSIGYDKYVSLSTSRIMTVTDHVQMIVGGIEDIFATATAIINIIILLVAIASIDPSLGLPILCVYTVGGILIRIVLYKNNSCWKAVKDAKYSRNKELGELVEGFAEVRSFRTQTAHYTSVCSKNKRINDLQLVVVRNIGAICCLFEVIDTIGLVLILGHSVNAITNGMSVSMAMTLVMYVWRMSQPMDTIVSILNIFGDRMTATKEFAELMAIEPPADGTVDLVKFNDKIEIKDLKFNYNNSDEVLNGIDLTIKKGQKIGICGASGGGKSTLLKLIPKFYTNFEGSIKIDDVNVRDLTTNSVRSKIGIVHQDTYIFDDTIWNNVSYGSPNATETNIIEAVKKANLYDFIQSLPEKFNTMVGTRGLTLSGGQKQRIALARIFLQNPDIIILDEATSALDNESERVILSSLQHFADKTIISVAHRLTTIQNCDKIVVIDNHRIAESGTHSELLAANGIYADLYRKADKAE